LDEDVSKNKLGLPMRATSHQSSLQSNKLVYFSCLPFKIAFQQRHRTNWNKILVAAIVSGLKPASRDIVVGSVEVT